MSDLVKRLRIKAGMIEMGEIIAWGSDTALMREAADALEMAAPAVQGEPVAWARMKNGKVISAFHDKVVAKFLAGFAASELVPLYMHPQPAPEAGECRKFTFWAVYDATSDEKYIKLDADTGCLAIFDIERHAAIFAADCAGVDYGEMVLYSCPQPADAALAEAFDAGRRAAQAEAAELAGALDGMIYAADVASWGGYFPTDAVTRAVEALATYRKQGGEA